MDLTSKWSDCDYHERACYRDDRPVPVAPTSWVLRLCQRRHPPDLTQALADVLKCCFETQVRVSVPPRLDDHFPHDAGRVSLLQIRLDQPAFSVVCTTLLPPNPGHLGVPF